MGRQSRLVGLVALLAVVAPVGTALAEQEGRPYDPIVDRRWRFVVGAPQFRLDTLPLGWGVEGEMGVQFLTHHMILVHGSARYLNGGGVGYLYEHEFVRRAVAIQAGGFLGGWIIDMECHDDMCEGPVPTFFAPTVRMIAGWAYVFVQVGFILYVGDEVVPSFDLGLHVKI